MESHAPIVPTGDLGKIQYGAFIALRRNKSGVDNHFSTACAVQQQMTRSSGFADSQSFADTIVWLFTGLPLEEYVVNVIVQSVDTGGMLAYNPTLAVPARIIDQGGVSGMSG